MQKTFYTFVKAADNNATYTPKKLGAKPKINYNNQNIKKQTQLKIKCNGKFHLYMQRCF